MENKNWFRPYGSEKECWLAAMADLYDGKSVDMYIVTLGGSRWEKRDKPSFLIAKKVRPIHKHRALIDLYWKYPGGRKWHIEFENGFKNKVSAITAFPFGPPLFGL